MEAGGRVIFDGAVWAEKSRRISGNLTEIRRDYSNTILQPYRQSTGAAKVDFAGTSRLAVCKTAGMSNSVI